MYIHNMYIYLSTNQNKFESELFSTKKEDTNDLLEEDTEFGKYMCAYKYFIIFKKIEIKYIYYSFYVYILKEQ